MTRVDPSSPRYRHHVPLLLMPLMVLNVVFSGSNFYCRFLGAKSSPPVGSAQSISMFKKGKYFAGWPWFWVFNWSATNPRTPPPRWLVILYFWAIIWCAMMLCIASLAGRSFWINAIDFVCLVYQVGIYVVRAEERADFLDAHEEDSDS